MSPKFKHRNLTNCITYSLLILFLTTTGYASEQKKLQDQQLPGLQVIVEKVKKAVRTKNFNILKPYASNKELLYWAACGPGDVESEKLSFGSMVQRLSKVSKGADIHMYDVPAVHLWDFEKSVFYTVNINTEGWTGEYPFLSFGFKFRTADNHWEFTGVCDATTPELTKKEGKYVPTYFKEPQLPRSGPRIFKDRSALRDRVEEIVQFKAFEALKPYATKKVLAFGQCNREMMDKDSVVGKDTPVQDVIIFLKNNLSTTREIKSSGMHHKTYYETTGWSGEYPFVAFWFSKKDKLWELAGVSYCKTRHFDLFPPLSPLK